MEKEIKENTLEETWWKVLYEFLIHIFVGTSIFVLIAAAAVLLDILISWLSSIGSNTFIIYGLKYGEYILFATDIILFTIYIIKTAINSYYKF